MMEKQEVVESSYVIPLQDTSINGNGVFYHDAADGNLQVEQIKHNGALVKVLIRLENTKVKDGMSAEDVMRAYELFVTRFPQVPALFSMHGGAWRDGKNPHYHITIDTNELFHRFDGQKVDELTEHLLKVLSNPVCSVDVQQYHYNNEERRHFLGTKPALTFQWKGKDHSPGKEIYSIVNPTTGFALDGWIQSVFWYPKLDNENQLFRVDVGIPTANSQSTTATTSTPTIDSNKRYVLAKYTEQLHATYPSSVVVYSIEHVKLSTCVVVDERSHSLKAIENNKNMSMSRFGSKSTPQPQLLLIDEADLNNALEPPVHQNEEQVCRTSIVWKDVEVAESQLHNRYFHKDLQAAQKYLEQQQQREDDEHKHTTLFPDKFGGLKLYPHPYLPMLLFEFSSSTSDEVDVLGEALQSLNINADRDLKSLHAAQAINDVLNLIGSLSITTYHLVMGTYSYSFNEKKNKKFAPPDCIPLINGSKPNGYILLKPHVYLSHCKEPEVWLAQYAVKGNIGIFT